MKKLKWPLWTAITGLLILFFGLQPVFAQSGEGYSDNWQLLNYQKDSVYGISLQKAYNELLKGKKPHQVIVAVIDSGVDTAHIDLQGHIWTNTDEIPGNNKDDDRNDYPDDIHGWNFLGGENGQSIVNASSELSREYHRLRPKFAGMDSAEVKRKNRDEYHYWLKIKEKKEKDSIKTMQNYATVSKAINRFLVWEKILESHIGKDTLFLSDLKDFNPDNDTLLAVKEIASRILSNSGPHQSLEGFVSEGQEYLQNLKDKMDKMDDDPNALREKVVGDDPDDIKDTDYGNNDVTGTFARHATHVAGIIAAVRNNGIGINGITNDVLIMPVKVVPNGDERDKDVALGIRYAVDNGADIINMSFGKGYSPHKKWVDEAVHYAAKHDVLLIHAAGNDGTNNDSIPSYPNPFFKKNDKRAENYVTVGASNPTNEEGHLAASFSNYGKNEVDLFAPGVNIYSTVPGNEYESLSGTSMATPVVTGVAALVLEYYPDLSAEQLRWVLDHSVTELDSVQVIKPGSNEKVPFSSLSISGGIVNAYKALKLAATLKGEGKRK